MSALALFIYASCCSVNWTWQLFYGARLFNVLEDRSMLYIYTFLIMFVVYDDIILMKVREKLLCWQGGGGSKVVWFVMLSVATFYCLFFVLAGLMFIDCSIRNRD
jgi:hypothetical protein